MKHLWEVDHAYYCNNGNYYTNEGRVEFKSWAEFIAEFGDADFDLNLVFRWDWKEEAGTEGKPTFTGDMNYRNWTLYIYWMGQRKGAYFWSEVSVCRADEQEVIKFLQPRLDYLRELWAPLTPATTNRTKGE